MTVPELITIPIFPLHTVLFPGGPLELRIFEPRYLDMVSRCLKEGNGFGVSLIHEGREVGGTASVFDIGTYGEITYWNRRPDGLLWITVTGRRRFRITRSRIDPGGLMMAEVEMLKPDPPVRFTGQMEPMRALARDLIENLDHPYINLARDYDDAGWVAARLSELLPLSVEQRQYLLQQESPLDRVERVVQICLEYGNGH